MALQDNAGMHSTLESNIRENKNNCNRMVSNELIKMFGSLWQPYI